MDSDDEICLSEHALKALQEFYLEQENNVSETSKVEENWELSQFWYDKNTTSTLANAALKAIPENGRIACISCPTIYIYLHDECNILNNIYLFEYDKRFQELYKEHFIYYDYNDPLNIPQTFQSYFDLVLADPPYLSEECLEKTLKTVQHVAKDKIILCTGAVMEDLANKLLSLRPCSFKPQHERKLGNEFKCYANWDFDSLVKQINVKHDL